MSELDELERDLEEAANIWFSPVLHAKMRRVIAIAREGERNKAILLEERGAADAQKLVAIDNQ
jgi:hypothetical protein